MKPPESASGTGYVNTADLPEDDDDEDSEVDGVSVS